MSRGTSTRLLFGGSLPAASIGKVSAIVWRSSGRGKTYRLCFKTTITRRATIAILREARSLTNFRTSTGCSKIFAMMLHD